MTEISAPAVMSRESSSGPRGGAPSDVIVLPPTAPQRDTGELADIVEILPGLRSDPLADDLTQDSVIELVVPLHHPCLQGRRGEKLTGLDCDAVGWLEESSECRTVPNFRGKALG